MEAEGVKLQMAGEGRERALGRIRFWNGWAGRAERLLLGVGSVVLLLLVWQIADWLGLTSALVFPSPSQVIDAFDTYVTGPSFAIDLSTSASEFAIGFGLAVVVGLPLGIAIGWSRLIKSILDPFVTFLYSVPRFALVPLMVVWLGIGIWSKVAVVFLGAIFAILITVSEGVRNLDQEIVQCAEAFGASRSQTLWTVGLPASVPFILSGLRLGIARGLTGVVVGELVVSEHGLGQAMEVAGTTFQTAEVCRPFL